MPTATFVQEGSTIDHTPGSDLAAGAVVVQGSLIGITRTPIPASTAGSLALTGVFELPKATGVGSAIDAGTVVYWDEAEQVAKADDESGANKALGKTIADAADADATVRVRLSQ